MDRRGENPTPQKDAEQKLGRGKTSRGAAHEVSSSTRLSPEEEKRTRLTWQDIKEAWREFRVTGTRPRPEQGTQNTPPKQER
jgi:hypothetical protein